MELRDFARRLVETDRLETKLAPLPADWSDERPGPPLRPAAPGRPAELAIVPGRQAPVPSLGAMADASQRPRILHALANHELQAAELFAWALLAFPAAPAAYRRGLLGVLADEQRHTRMYIARLEAAGASFGQFPVSGYFWNKTPSIRSPLGFVCAMSLTFENANLDHTLEYAEAARQAGDTKTAAVIEKVHADEVRHVRFGWTWLQRLKAPGQGAWDAYREALTWPLRPAKARGRQFHRAGRVAAGLDEDFIRRLEASEP